jgi:hypothetical protein
MRIGVLVLVAGFTCICGHAESFACAGPVVQADVTVHCGFMPYKAIAALSPGILGAAPSDAVQLWIGCLDDSVAAYRVTVRLSDRDDPVVLLLKRSGQTTVAEISIADISSLRITALRIEKLHPDPPLDFVSNQ